MTARFIVGDTRAVTATFPDGSVELIMSSPPYLALRSYLPADHPSKHLEIGSEATPAEFIDILLALTAEWRRILNPRTGSIVIELGDTYAGSGGAGGDYGPDGLREGQPKFKASRSGWHRLGARGDQEDQPPNYRKDGTVADSATPNAGPGWPRPKSNCGIPGDYAFALRHGYNPYKGSLYHDESPAGRWQVRNTITRCSPNPPVGALGKKWRPATTDLVVATPDDDRRYWDDIATRTATSPTTRPVPIGYHAPAKLADPQHNNSHDGYAGMNPAGAPLLDWWQIVAGGYPGAHYAVYPPELCEPFIEAMCPRRVCLQCGEPSRRETERDSEAVEANVTARNGKTKDGRADEAYGAVGISKFLAPAATTTGWTTCGHPGTDGLMMDGYHMGTGWRPGMVLDPFAGTFTTGAVATGHGRDAIGIDLDDRNAELALERVGPLLLTVEHHDTTTAA